MVNQGETSYRRWCRNCRGSAAYRDYRKRFCRSLPSAQCETGSEIQTRQNSYRKQQGNLDYTDLYDKRDYLNLVEWSVADVNGDLAQCGLSGSPTKVKAIQNIVFQAKESKTISGSDRDVEDLIVELLANHTIG